MFSISTRHMARIYTYEAARNVWERAKVWRNRDPDDRGLAGDRDQNKRIKKTAEGFECILYRTAVVTYLHDGGLVLRNWPSVSTVMFADCVTPQGVYLQHGGNFWSINTAEGTQFHEGDLLTLRPGPREGLWEVTGGVVIAREKVKDIPMRRRIQKATKPYLQWYEMTRRLKAGHGSMPVASSVHHPSQAMELLEHLETGATENYTELSKRYTPQQLLDFLYEYTPAHFTQDVPLNRMPRPYKS